MQQSTFEQDHVHAVYDSIAKDFSRTRHTRWPFVEHFLGALPAGSVVLDSGCGNGKYLGCRTVLSTMNESGAWTPDIESAGNAKGKGKKMEEASTQEGNILPIGFDMSTGLLGIAGGKGHEVVRGDCFDMSCWRRGAFDHAISIATIHHFATPERRLESVKQLILAVIPAIPSASTLASTSSLATVLIVVWALEQDPALAGIGSARRGKKGAVPVPIDALSASSLDAPHPTQRDAAPVDEQDVFVPWQLQAPRVPKPPHPNSLPRSKRGQLSSPQVLPDQPLVEKSETPRPTFNRYYHLFRNGELSDLVQSAAAEVAREEAGWELVVGLQEEERWERENWVVVISVSWRRKDSSPE